MSIKITRAAKISIIGNNPQTFAAMAGAIPDSVIKALTSKQLAELIDANYSLSQKSKAVADREAFENGGVWDNTRGCFCELQGAAH